MNCCDEYCCNDGCNQGRNCPARKTTQIIPAKVAKAKPMYRRCDVMGICQAPDAECAANCILHDTIAPDPDPVDATMDWVMTWLAFAMCAIVLCAGLAFILGLHADTLAAWIDWIQASLRLTLYRWANTWS
jgi:hypothetical protein